MNTNNFTTTILLRQNARTVYDSIMNVYGWWSEDFKGSSQKLNEEFEVRFGDVHYSRQKLVELVPDTKIVWLVTDSYLSFLLNKEEWTGTTISFEIAGKDDKTELNFTHHGLVPQIECFKDCSKGWNHYLLNSLFPFITTGEGKPNKKSAAIEA